MADNTSGATPAISVPKGGGAITGIGETFQPNPFMGTGNFSVPVFASPGRAGFGPTLSLQYSTGYGNGPFGLGWELSIPRVTRKTEKGLPAYGPDDVFLLSGAEDLVAHLARIPDEPNRWMPVVEQRGDFVVHLFRPRTEGQFTRVERWQRPNGDTHWRTTTTSNLTSVFGFNPQARVSDPANPNRTFEWLLEETFDTRGNHMLYEYVQEDPALVLDGLHEQHRSYGGAYLRRILYGNTPDSLDPTRRAGLARFATDHRRPLSTRERHYVFELLFDYGDLPETFAIPTVLPRAPERLIPREWPVRADPFSTYRAGFEVRTLRRCARVLMLHHFDEPGLTGAPIVKSTEFGYQEEPHSQLSLLTSVTSRAYRRDPADDTRYFDRALPPVTFAYTAFQPGAQRFQPVVARYGDLPPFALNRPELALVDVAGDGLPDVLHADDTGFHLWRNLGDGRLDARRPQPGGQPSVSLAQSGVALADLAGDGLFDLLVDAPPMSGVFESTANGRWRRFKRFESMPTFSLSDPNTRLIDLTGDGLSDVVSTRDEFFLWHQCLGESGFAEPRVIPRRHDVRVFPDVFFDDPSGRVRLADMSGDGLTDIVLVHDGRLDYWPNQGHGAFAPRRTMVFEPHIGQRFDPARLFLADVDGTGCSDLVYVDVDRIHLWFNQSGNTFGPRHTIPGTPRVSDATALEFADFFGTGTTAVLWTEDFAHQAGGNYKVLDFCGSVKPHLLVEMRNNRGSTTRVSYAASTRFARQDAAAGSPWITSLPFPVHVVEKTEMVDEISRTTLVTSFRYHHGYYDGREREFRGFGRVDQFDAESFPDGDDHVPPVETRTWFHTGIFFDRDREIDAAALTERFRHEFYAGDTEAFTLDDHLFEDPTLEGDSDAATNTDTLHESHRALRGAVLRTEVYGRDGSDQAAHPYSVTESRYTVRTVQPRGAGNLHAVYLTTLKESLAFQYERRAADPRIAATIALGVDAFGNVTDSVSIAYPRRVVPDDWPEQAATSIVYTHTDYINTYTPPSPDGSGAGCYLARIPCQVRTYDVTGFRWHAGEPALEAERFEAILDRSLAVDPATFEPYDADVDRGPQGDVTRRLLGWTRTYFRSDSTPATIDPIGSLEHRLALGVIASLALPYETYTAAHTRSMLRRTYEDRIDGVDLPIEGGFHPHPNHPAAEGGNGIEEYFWIPSGRRGFDEEKFLEAHRAQDAFGGIGATETDDYALLLERASDALPVPQTNVMAARNDYRVLQPFEATDPNGSVTRVAFDVLGLVVGQAIMGTDADGAVVGDSLDGFVADLPAETEARHLDDPLNLAGAPDGDPHAILGNASFRIIYSLHRFTERGDANVVYTVRRETHASHENGTPSRLHHAFVYSDASGREVQHKIQAEAGRGRDGRDLEHRWLGTGWTLFNNKGQPVRKFEPFFGDTHRFESDVRVGVSAWLFLDPAARVVATLHPNHTWLKTVFDPWRQDNWDVNDTVLLDPRGDLDVGHHFRGLPDDEYLPTWHAQRADGALGPEEQTAAARAAVHAATPSVAHLDPLSRPFLTVAHNRFIPADGETGDPAIVEFHPTRVAYDIQGHTLTIVDPLGRVVVRYRYDMTGACTRQSTMDAGERWTLNDIVGQPIREWDSREHRLRRRYDPLRRPTDVLLSERGAAERIVARHVYGESMPEPEAHHRRGRPLLAFDQAGVVTTDEYDFKGNLLRSGRQLAREYRTTLDWSREPLLEEKIYRTHTTFDAINRPVRVDMPDASVIRLTYNDAALLQRVDVNLRGEAASTNVVAALDYDAKGQRARIEYGNGVHTTHTYDPLTLRTTRTTTRRGDDVLQDLRYTYDPGGNITHIRDQAQQTIFFRNRLVEPSAEFVYDAVYRLIEASGREHLGQMRDEPGTPRPPDGFDGFRTRLLHPGDGNAMGRYLERYAYDAAGNILSVRHIGTDPAQPGWTREYIYNEPSHHEPDERANNRLSRTVVGDTVEPYEYAGSPGILGCITAMPHVPHLAWNFSEQLQATARQVVRNGTPETTYYVYDGSGERVRVVTERDAGPGETPTRLRERVYTGGIDFLEEYAGDGMTITLARETLHVMGHQRRIALVDTRTIGDDGTPRQVMRYQVANHLGSSNLELDAQARIISYEDAYPYGSTSYQSVARQNDAPKRYRFTGQERDDETGFYYHGARYYAPWLGRWSSTDPIGPAGGLNLYAYAANNPVKYVDPNGAEPEPRISADEFASGFITDYPHAGQAWDALKPRALEKAFGMGSYEANYDEYLALLDEVGEGSARTAIAREVFDGVRPSWYQSLAKLYRSGTKVFGYELSEETLLRMENGVAPARLQLDHGLHELALVPSEALTATNIGPRTGHAMQKRGGTHYMATQGRRALRLTGSALKSVIFSAPGPDDIVILAIGYGSSVEDARETLGNNACRNGAANALATVVLGSSPEETKRHREYGMLDDVQTRVLKSVGRSEAEYNDCFDGTLIHHVGLSAAQIAELQMAIVGPAVSRGVDLSSPSFALEVGTGLQTLVDGVIQRQLQEIQSEKAAKTRRDNVAPDSRLNSMAPIHSGGTVKHR